MQSIEIEGLSYHIRSFGFFRLVLVTDVPKTPEDIIQMVGFRFIKEYGEVLMDWDSNLSIFTPFQETLREIIQTETSTDDSKSIRPSRKLSTGEIFQLPPHLQKTALAMISLEQGTLSEISEESGEKKRTVRKNINTLQEMGFIGTRQDKKTITYFCSI
ncbi:MAG: hypothetical protein ACFFC6_13675 [Promethearchaeota archaeon]